MKIFVTGGAGFIGSNFIQYVLALDGNHSIVNFDKLTYAGNLANLQAVAGDLRYKFVKGDICDPEAVHRAMAQCEVVVHFAAESHVDRSIYEPAPAIQTNVTGTAVLLQVARALKVRRFLHVSTDEVYGDLVPGAFADENFPLQPSSPYAASKAASDLLVGSFIRTYQFPAVITRSSNNYGAFQFPEKLVPLMIVNATADRRLPVYGDGRQQRDWLHVEDNCRALMAALEHGRVGEVYNIGSTAGVENLDLVARLLKIMRKPDSLIDHVVDRPGHDRRYAMNCSKAERELGWRPLIALESGLERTVRWYGENTDWVASVCCGEYRTYYERHYVHRESSLEAVMMPGSDAATTERRRCDTESGKAGHR